MFARVRGSHAYGLIFVCFALLVCGVHVTSAEEDKVEAVFKFLDTDGSGGLSLPEMAGLFWVLNENAQKLINETLDSWNFSHRSDIEDGQVTAKALTNHWTEMIEYEMYDELFPFFLDTSLEAAKESFNGLAQQLVTVTLKRYDSNGDGRLSQEEMLEWYNYFVPLVDFCPPPYAGVVHPMDVSSFKGLIDDGSGRVDQVYARIQQQQEQQHTAPTDASAEDTPAADVDPSKTTETGRDEL